MHRHRWQQDVRFNFQNRTVQPPVNRLGNFNPLVIFCDEGKPVVWAIAPFPAPHGVQLGHGAVRQRVQGQREGQTRPVLRVDVAARRKTQRGKKANFQQAKRRRLGNSPLIVQKRLVPRLVLRVVGVLPLVLVFEVVEEALRVAGRRRVDEIFHGVGHHVALHSWTWESFACHPWKENSN